jgi:primosomal protein N' (replication factor Y)
MLSDSPPQVILGARSAVFLPFTSLQLVVVDEESETSYKQQEPAPRYNGRDAAVYLATLHGANTLLGSATPSIESYYNALKGKYVLVELATRYADIALPEIETVDTAYLRRVRLMRNTLSPALQKEMETALKAHEQVILFRNRRGFAPFTYCPNCGWSPRCPHCDVPLSYHKHNHRLQCHYCGAVSMPKEVCPDCNTDSLRQSGAGTERIEEDVKLCFPHAKIIRMDTDTTRGRHSFEKMLSDFSQHKADILLGTQMVAKGLDFDNVSACGIIDADQMLNNPDFRAYERAFQMLTQVSGRAGRKNRQGKVLVQTAQPDNPVLSFVKQNNYSAFFETVAAERRIFGYPPFSRLIAVYLQHSKDETVQDASVAAANYLRNQLGEKYVLGPSRPATVRIHNLFVQKILLKITPKTGGDAARQALKDCRTFLKNKEDCRSVWVYFDADPV